MKQTTFEFVESCDEDTHYGGVSATTDRWGVARNHVRAKGACPLFDNEMDNQKITIKIIYIIIA